MTAPELHTLLGDRRGQTAQTGQALSAILLISLLLAALASRHVADSLGVRAGVAGGETIAAFAVLFAVLVPVGVAGIVVGIVATSASNRVSDWWRSRG